MKPLIFALLLLVASTANAQLTTDSAFGVAHDAATLKLNYLPQDGEKPYLTIFGTAGPRFEQAKAWFDNNPELRRLKASSHFNTVDTASAMFRDRYAASTPAALTIRVQDASGKILHESTDGQIPMSAEAFIRKTNSTDCFRRHRQQATPADPEPQPLTPPSPPMKRQSPAWPAVTIAATLAAIVGGFFGVRSKWKETHL